MLKLAYLGESKNLNIEKNILKLLIVRRPVGKIPKGFIHVPQLSPSNNLFEKTQNWKAKKFNKEELEILKLKDVFSVDENSWWYLYEDAFMLELQNRKDMIKAVKRLKERLLKGEDIYLFCYCKDVCSCHRGLIGKYIEKDGFEVDYRRIEKSKENIETERQLSLFNFQQY